VSWLLFWLAGCIVVWGASHDIVKQLRRSCDRRLAEHRELLDAVIHLRHSIEQIEHSKRSARYFSKQKQEEIAERERRGLYTDPRYARGEA
jgi:hypothetical protein